MRRHPHVHCRECGKHRDDEGGRLSATGLCLMCAEARCSANLAQLDAGEGPYFDHWARRLYMAARKQVLEELMT